MNEARLIARTKKLAEKHGMPLSRGAITGAYHDSPRREVEILIHDVAHWLTLGNPIEKLPSRLFTQLDNTFNKISQASANSLEIDASVLTFLTGYRLGIWTDPQDIAYSCRKNLRGAHVELAVILKEFQERGKSPAVWDYSAIIAKWFKPSQKLLNYTPGIFGEEPAKSA